MEAEEDGVILSSETGVNWVKRTVEDMEASCDNKRIKTDMDVCKCDNAVKVKAIEEVLESSKDVNSNLIIQKVKHILKPMKYSEEYSEEDDTKIKLEPVTVKTEPFIIAESIKTEPEEESKIKLEPVSVKSEPFLKAESRSRESPRRKRSRSCQTDSSITMWFL